jgi:hypothetical protein
MDPPGSLHEMTTEPSVAADDAHVDEIYSRNDDDDNLEDGDHPSREEPGESYNEVASIPAQPESAPSTTTTTNHGDDDDNMRSSLSAATQNYRAYRNMGGDELTMKRSIDSTRVIVPIPAYAASTNPPTTTTTTEPGGLNSPIIATAVRVEMVHDDATDTPVFMASPLYPLPQQQPPQNISSNFLSPHIPLEQVSLQQQKHNLMVERLVAELDYPSALAKRLVTCIQTQFVKHYWLIDNSGSMLTTDCVRMVPKDIFDVGASNVKNTKKLYDTVKCSRWNELENAIISHIDLASILEVPTTFRLLQGTRGMQEFTINQVPDDVESAKSIVRQSKPDGVTLLSDHIHEICNHIEEDKHLLLERGQKAVVVIATDAIPSDQYGDTSEEAKEKFFIALKKLQLLPVWIVIRLCTNDRKAMQYYRKLDKKLEIPIECVSDYITESKEVRRWNPWLNYSRQIHQCREMGFHHRVFDLLDERPLTKDDLLEFLTVLFGAEAFETNVAPNIHTHWNDFLQYLKNQVLNLCEKQYSPTSKKMEDIIDVKGLATAHGIRGSIRNTINKIDY